MSFFHAERIGLAVLVAFSIVFVLQAPDSPTGFVAHDQYRWYSQHEGRTNTNQRSLHIQDAIIYKYAMYSVNETSWQRITLNGISVQGSDWLQGTGTYTLPVNMTGPGLHYLITYTCTNKTPKWNSWNCHGNETEDERGSWQLKILNNEQICTPRASSSCHDDDIYWYDSCGNLGTLKEACDHGCGDGTCSPPPENCTDGKQNQDEEGIDCGGSVCEPCREEIVIAINCGGSTYEGSDGTDYLADQHYTATGECSDYYNGQDIAGTTDDEIYHSDRCAHDDGDYTRGTITYEIPLSSGDYNVTLKFAEIWFGTSRTTETTQRQMDVSIEGTQVMNDIDIRAAAGGALTAYDRTFPTTVSDESLNIQIRGVTHGPKISAIVVRGGGEPGQTTTSCHDDIQNQGEAGIDCGGPCPPCCTPDSTAVTCQGKCDAQTNNCGETVWCGACGSTPIDGIFVSPTGSDSGSGTITSPFKTLEKARDHLRTHSEDTVWIRGGMYERSATFTLDSRDDHTTWKAYPGEQATIIGGKRLDPARFSKVTSASPIWNRVHDDAKGHLLQFNIAAVTQDYGNIPKRGFDITRDDFDATGLVIDGQKMVLGRWPNYVHDYEPGSDDDHFVRIHDADCDLGYDTTCNRYPQFFTYSGDYQDRWSQAEDPWIYGFLKISWSSYHVAMSHVDPTTNQFYIDNPGPSTLSKWAGGVAKNGLYYTYNLLEEIDEPGEWYLNRQTGWLYVYPPKEDISSSTILISTLEAPLIELQNTHGVVFDSIDFSMGRDELIVMDGGSDNIVKNSILNGAEEFAARISGDRNGIEDSEITQTEEGVYFSGDIVRRYCQPGTAQNSFVRNTKIHALYGDKGVQIDCSAVGIDISHNEFSEIGGIAIHYCGNNHHFGYNDIKNVGTHYDDQAAIYQYSDWSSRGTKIEYNYIHDLETVFSSPDNRRSFGAFSFINAIYLDEAASGQTVVGNIIENVQGRGLWHRSGKDNVFRNNIVIDAQRAGYAIDAVVYSVLQDNDMTQTIFYNLYSVLVNPASHLSGKGYVPTCTNAEGSSRWYDEYPELESIPIPVCPQGYYTNDGCYWTQSDWDLKEQYKVNKPTGNVFSNNIFYTSPAVRADPNYREEIHDYKNYQPWPSSDYNNYPSTFTHFKQHGPNCIATTRPVSSSYRADLGLCPGISFSQIPFEDIGIQT